MPGTKFHSDSGRRGQNLLEMHRAGASCAKGRDPRLWELDGRQKQPSVTKGKVEVHGLECAFGKLEALLGKNGHQKGKGMGRKAAGQGEIPERLQAPAELSKS